MLLALKTQQTSVVNLSIGPYDSFEVDVGSNQWHPNIIPLQTAAKSYGSHKEYYLRARQYVDNKVSDFIQQLIEQTDTQGQPLIDSTLLVLTSSFGNADDNDNRDVPVLLAGGEFLQAGKTLNLNTNNEQVLDTITELLQLQEVLPQLSVEGAIDAVVAVE